MGDRPHDVRAFVNEIEGHLLLAAAREEGRTAATRFTARLGWLTDTQRDEVEREFETEYLSLARASWQRTAERAEELRREYEGRYRALRQRLLAGVALGCALLASAGLLLYSLSLTPGGQCLARPVHAVPCRVARIPSAPKVGGIPASRGHVPVHFWWSKSGGPTRVTGAPGVNPAHTRGR